MSSGRSYSSCLWLRPSAVFFSASFWIYFDQAVDPDLGLELMNWREYGVLCSVAISITSRLNL